MNQRFFKLFIALSFVLVINSCTEDDDFPAPVIENMEIGLNNSMVAYRGSDLHLEADIIAEGRIDRIVVEIHPEGEHDHDKKSGNTVSDHDHGWETEITWDEYKELKNTNFHKHIDVPLEAELGEHHLHFKVIDMQGKETSLEADIEVKNPENTDAAVLSITSAPENGEIFHADDTISISGSATHELGLGGMYIGLVIEDQGLEDSQVNANNTITILHTHDFDSPTSHNFDAGIVVGAEEDNNITPKPIEGDIAWQEGNYYILAKAKDAFGGPFGFSDRYPVEIHFHD
ncbi:MAG: DUF4625 domain-containing protein [Bacteroidota bacterium]